MTTIKIPKTEHKTFPFAFLADMFVGIDFEHPRSNEEWEEIWPEIDGFFQRFFNQKITIEEFLSKSPVELDVQNGIKFVFSPNFAILQVSREYYHNFLNSALPHISVLKWFIFNSLKQEYVKRITIGKKNLFPFKAQSKDLALSAYYDKRAFFSSGFTALESTGEYHCEDALTKREEKTVSSEGIIVSLSTLLAGLQNNQYVLAFHLIGTYGDKYNNISQDGLDPILVKINDAIFNAFTWSVSDKVLSLMNNLE